MAITPAAVEAMESAWEISQEYVKEKKRAYGLTTMFGHDKTTVRSNLEHSCHDGRGRAL